MSVNSFGKPSGLGFRWVENSAGEHDLKLDSKVLLTVFRCKDRWRVGYSLTPQSAGADEYYSWLRSKTLSSAKREAYRMWQKTAKDKVVEIQKMLARKEPVSAR